MGLNWLFIILIYYALVCLVLVNVILTWIPSSQWHPAGRFFLKITEPLLKPFRRLLPPVNFATVTVDFSPTIALVILYIAYYITRRLMLGF